MPEDGLLDAFLDLLITVRHKPQLDSPPTPKQESQLLAISISLYFFL